VSKRASLLACSHPVVFGVSVDDRPKSGLYSVVVLNTKRILTEEVVHEEM